MLTLLSNAAKSSLNASSSLVSRSRDSMRRGDASCTNANTNAQPREETSDDQGYVVVEVARPDVADDDFEFLGSDSDSDSESETACKGTPVRRSPAGRGAANSITDTNSTDGFEDQRIYGCSSERGGRGDLRRAVPMAPHGGPISVSAPIPAAPIWSARAATALKPFQPTDNAFSVKAANGVARRVSLPSHSLPTAPFATQLGLRAAHKPARSMTAPESFPKARMTDSTVD